MFHTGLTEKSLFRVDGCPSCCVVSSFSHEKSSGLLLKKKKKKKKREKSTVIYIYRERGVKRTLGCKHVRANEHVYLGYVQACVCMCLCVCARVCV